MAASPTASLLRRLARPRRAVRRPEPADLGTAFGLEMSMAPPTGPLPLAAPSLRVRPRWWQRLLRRRPSA
jgi:hypothetical protein